VVWTGKKKRPRKGQRKKRKGKKLKERIHGKGKKGSGKIKQPFFEEKSSTTDSSLKRSLFANYPKRVSSRIRFG